MMMWDHYNIISSLPSTDTLSRTELWFRIFWASGTTLLVACSFRGRLPARHNLRRLPVRYQVWGLAATNSSPLGRERGGGKHLPTRDYSISSLGTAPCGAESTEMFRVPWIPAVQKCVAIATNEIFWMNPFHTLCKFIHYGPVVRFRVPVGSRILSSQRCPDRLWGSTQPPI
jgi:hypothetical protein